MVGLIHLSSFAQLLLLGFEQGTSALNGKISVTELDSESPASESRSEGAQAEAKPWKR